MASGRAALHTRLPDASCGGGYTSPTHRWVRWFIERVERQVLLLMALWLQCLLRRGLSSTWRKVCRNAKCVPVSSYIRTWHEQTFLVEVLCNWHRQQERQTPIVVRNCAGVLRCEVRIASYSTSKQYQKTSLLHFSTWICSTDFTSAKT